jgi:hypothetical protein
MFRIFLLNHLQAIHNIYKTMYQRSAMANGSHGLELKKKRSIIFELTFIGQLNDSF